MPDRRLLGQRQSACLGDLVDIDEITALLAILKDQRRTVVEEARGEDRQHAGVWVGERLMGPIHIEEPQGDSRDVVSFAYHQAKPLLVVFR